MLLTRRQLLETMSALFALPHLPSLALPDDPLAGTALAFQAGRARGAWSAEEVTRTALDRSYAWNRVLHCTDLLADQAIADARASDARMRKGTLRGPLDGAPVFGKSIYDHAGLPTTASSADWSALFPAPLRRDAIEIERLRAAGAIVIGKTAADDFAYHGNGTSSLSGQVANPYDPTRTRTPGGSSAGSAVGVACGIAFAALGTDDGGSNRIPAQFTGVVGMKPTFGLVPRTGVIPTWPFLDTHGPLARTVADAALLLDAIAGPDPSDPFSLSAPWVTGALASLDPNALRGARLGVVDAHIPRTQMPAESVALFDRAVADLERAGATVVPFAPPVTRHDVERQFREAAESRGDVRPNPRAPAPTAAALYQYFDRHGGDAEDRVRHGFEVYRIFYDVLPERWEGMRALLRHAPAEDPAGASFARSRAALNARLADAFREQRLDAMIYPTMPFPAPRAVDDWPDIRTPLGYGNWLGIPEVSVPSGYGTDGMPGGNLSFVGIPGSDARLLALAHSYEQVSQRFRPPPLPA